MKSIRVILTVVLAASMFILQSCGSSNTGGTSVFETVDATASVDAAKNPLLSDLAKWTGTACADGSTFSIDNDLVNFNVATTVNIKNGTPSPLNIQKATITFEPADSLTPKLPALFTPDYRSLLGYQVPAGGSLSFPVEIASHNLKQYLGAMPPQGLGLVCTNISTTYTYNVIVTFDAVETNTGKRAPIQAGMTVKFYDFND